MAKSVFINRVVAFGPRRISWDANRVTLEPMRAEVPDDNLEDLHDKILKGAHQTDCSVAGGTSSELEQRFLSQLAGERTDQAGPTVVEVEALLPFSLCMARGGGAGTRAALSYGKAMNFRWSGDRGARKDFEFDVDAEDPMAWGLVLFQGFGTAGITVATEGPAVELGAVGAGEELVLHYHILEPPGVSGTTPTLDADLESAPSDAFAAPVVRASLTQATGPTSQRLLIDGDSTPVTDTFWRLNFAAPGGTTPNFLVMATAAIRTK